MTGDTDDEALDAFFAAGRAAGPGPSDALMARVLADAEAVQAAREAAALRPRPGLWAAALAALGGWGAVSGLAAAALTGVWIGVAGIGQIGPAVTGVFGAATVALFPDETDFFALAGGWEDQDG